MRILSFVLLLVMGLLAGCGPSLRAMAKVPSANKRTVAFWSDAQYVGRPAPFQAGILEGFASYDATNYLCRLVRLNEDSVRKVMSGPRELKAYPGSPRARSRLGRTAQAVASAAGVDHIMYTWVDRETETVVLQAAQEHTALEKIFLGKKDTPAVLGDKLKKVTFRLKYIDGHTGRTLWKTKVKFKGGFRGFDKMNAIVAKKFHKRFPYRVE